MGDDRRRGRGRESPLWADALLPRAERRASRSSRRSAPEHALGLETIYEGYLVHYGRSRLFAPTDADTALLLGDYLYAHGLVRVARSGDVAAVADLAELISLCAQARAEGGTATGPPGRRLPRGSATAGSTPLATSSGCEGDGGALDAAARGGAGDEAVDAALAAHARLVG